MKLLALMAAVVLELIVALYLSRMTFRTAAHLYTRYGGTQLGSAMSALAVSLMASLVAILMLVPLIVVITLAPQDSSENGRIAALVAGQIALISALVIAWRSEDGKRFRGIRARRNLD